MNSDSLFITTDSATGIAVQKLHINIWNVFFSFMTAEIGLMLRIPREYFTGSKSFALNMSLPYSSKNEKAINLFEMLSDEKIIQLIFNEQVLQKSNITYNDGKLPFFKLTNDLSFLLFKPEFSNFSNSNKITILFNLSGINMSSCADLRECGHVLVYTRIRYSIDIKHSNTIHEDSHFLHKSVYIDLRVNEARTGTNINNILQIEMVQFFLISPLKKSVIELGKRRHSVRLLETEHWKPYFKSLRLVKKPLLVHYWKEKLESSYNSLSVVNYERTEIRYFLSIITLCVFASLIFTYWDIVKQFIIDSTNFVTSFWLWIIGCVVGLFLLVKAHLLSDLLVLFIKSSCSRLAKKFKLKS